MIQGHTKPPQQHSRVLRWNLIKKQIEQIPGGSPGLWLQSFYHWPGTGSRTSRQLLGARRWSPSEMLFIVQGAYEVPSVFSFRAIPVVLVFRFRWRSGPRYSLGMVRKERTTTTREFTRQVTLAIIEVTMISGQVGRGYIYITVPVILCFHLHPLPYSAVLALCPPVSPGLSCQLATGKRVGRKMSKGRG